MNGMNPQIIAKLDELRALIGNGGNYATFSIHQDAEGGISYTSTSADSDGNSVQITERRAPKKATTPTPTPPISSPPAVTPNNP